MEWRGDERVLLTMKAQDTEAALRDLRTAGADPDTTPIFCVQNCIANERIAARYFARVYGVMIVIPGIYLEPGVVHNPIVGNHGFMDIGCYPNGVDEEAAQMVEAIRAAGYAAQPHENVMASKGAKFLGNLGNALGAVTDGRGDAGPFMARVREEAETCLRAAGLPFEDPATYRERCHTNRGKNAPTEGMEDITNRGSSWQSLKRGQGSVETDFLNGEVVLLGRIHGIPTPCNRVLQRVANEMARLRQPPGRYTAEELTAMADAL
jgi:2-dehydropantoate 2-reductase